MFERFFSLAKTWNWRNFYIFLRQMNIQETWVKKNFDLDLLDVQHSHIALARYDSIRMLIPNLSVHAHYPKSSWIHCSSIHAIMQPECVKTKSNHAWPKYHILLKNLFSSFASFEGERKFKVMEWVYWNDSPRSSCLFLLIHFQCTENCQYLHEKFTMDHFMQELLDWWERTHAK